MVADGVSLAKEIPDNNPGIHIWNIHSGNG